ncbi:MAG: hypothetical protein ILP02_00870, partial [Clostridia bacterium]|nr:hypothetical protein [Clostridia bacterium]
MLVFFAPIVYFFILRMGNLSMYASQAPFSANLGVGYAPYPDLVAQEERIMLSVNGFFFMWLPVCAIWLGVGLSGAMYVMRNICWGEDVSLIKDFFLGVKRNWLPVIILTVAFAVVFSAGFIGVTYIDYIGAAKGGKAWYDVVAIIFIIIGMSFAGLWYLTMLAMSVTFKAKPLALIKNGLLITGVLLPANAFYAVFALIPFVFLMLGQMFIMLGVMAAALIGVSFFMLVWTVYSQWIYDKFINGGVKETYTPTEKDENMKKAREAAKSASGAEDEGYEIVGGGEEKEYAANAKPITDTSMTVTDLPATFTFDDILAMKNSKRKLKLDAEEYSADPQAYKKAHKGQFDGADAPAAGDTTEPAFDDDGDASAASDEKQ